MRYPNLFKPLTLNKLTLRNRIVSTAHAEVYAEPGGLPGDRYIRYYEEKAKGGVGPRRVRRFEPGVDRQSARLVEVGESLDRQDHRSARAAGRSDASRTARRS